MLRDAESLGLTVVWACLYGFPGEVDGVPGARVRERFGQTDVGAVIDRFMEPGLLFTDAGRVIHIVTKDRNQRFMQIQVGQGLLAADRPAPAPVAV
ncbi:hypothetical protein ACSNOJ_13910 [Streptomyces sp. URMC 128]|uniref:hypothetical protein n=1 Tax=Streptomyces sp. URMC 128 TaxID=3423404 RepID=UPI003F1D9AA5